MSIKLLKQYIELCSAEGSEPTWDGLNEFKINNTCIR